MLCSSGKAKKLYEGEKQRENHPQSGRRNSNEQGAEEHKQKFHVVTVEKLGRRASYM